MKEKLKRLADEQVEVIHLGICTKSREGKECPQITRTAELLEQSGITVVRGTH